MEIRLGKAFPVRLFGFSLFWTWLFLVAVSPSPLFGLLRGVGDTPFEVSEVGFRVAFLACAALFSKRWANPVGVRALSGACIVAGPLSVVALLFARGPVAVTAAGALAAVADVAMFLMWMCFFGYAKLGETALLLALSYAFGSLLCLLAVALGDAVMMLFAVVLPVASALAFMLSTRYSLDQGGEVLFGSVGQDAPARPRSPSVARLTLALLLYAFAFALYSCRTATSEFGLASGPLLQCVGSLVVAGVVVGSLRGGRRGAGLYLVYRGVPVLFAAGFALFALMSETLGVAAGLCVMTAYLLFEVLSLNDYCNVAKTNDASLARSMAFVRFAMSAGMLAGWLLGVAMAALMPQGVPPELVSIAGFMVVVVASTLVFTDKLAEELQGVAGDRALQEQAERAPDRTEFISRFAAGNGLSGREAEVLGYLLAGRTTQYIAEKLFIADSTARTHVHKIYAKTDTHDRMDLLDSFERFYEAHRGL